MRHRAEIDGLRAVAVLPVIFFHAGFGVFRGGFIGVDIFFVISGYLITRLIAEERAGKGFSLAEFYERRARRILPALCLVLACCVPAAWWWMNASDFVAFSRSLAAVSVFSSGLLFMLTAGYFDTSSDFKPLLHTWSLGVEEQFYLVFPPVFLLLARLGRHALLPAMLALMAASLWLAHWGAQNFPNSSFYFMPTRAWELLMGSILALWEVWGPRKPGQLSPARLTPRPAWLGESLSVIGMGMIVTALLLYDHHTPFPSVYALVPTVGAALVIGFGHASTWVGRLLATPWLTGIGLISYSAYLWHQPLLAFARHAHGSQPGQGVMFGMAVLSLVLAYITWRWVETPLRNRQFMSRKQVLAASGAFTVGFLALGMAGNARWVTTRWEQQHPHLVNHSPVADLPMKSCRELIRQASSLGDCQQIGEGSRTLVVWGDSHARALQTADPGLKDTRVVVITQPGCPPLPGLRRFDNSDSAHGCNDVAVVNAFARVVESLKPNTVVLASRWMLYLRGWMVEGRAQTVQHYMVSDGHDEAVLNSMAYRQQMLQRHLQAIVNRLAARSQVWILTQPMDMAQRAFREVESGDLAIPRSEVLEWHAPETALFQHLQLPAQARIIDLKRLFCNEQTCATRLGGRLLYRDDNHLSAFGVQQVWKALGRQAAAPPTGAMDLATRPGSEAPEVVHR